jgi:hypothetical protein
LDAIRPSGISASDAEHNAALDKAQEIELYLHDLGWPDPIHADSGNGAHLLYPVDLPCDDGGVAEHCLAALAERFDDDVVKVDRKVFNPSRIWKLYGTRACKGDDTAERPHRMAQIIEPIEHRQIVPMELLQELVAMAPATAASKASTNGQHSSQSFDIDAFISRHGFDLSGPNAYQGGRKWTFNRSPLCDHHDNAPYLIQFGTGALAAGCHHDSCSWDWATLRTTFEPRASRASTPRHEQSGEMHQEAKRPPVEKFTFADLRKHYPRLPSPVVDGLFRLGDTVNVISVSKIGKSWFAYGLALSIITGSPWLGFETLRGDVLLIDNELPPPVIANRIPKVAEALGHFPSDFENRLEVWPLRGKLLSLVELRPDIEAIEHGKFKLIILDAKYRFALPGVSENDNAAEAMTYNLLDQYAAQTGSAIVLIHHSSKGSQSDKRTTDVGAGAGAQSRAADAHLILREHEDEGVFVLDAAVRSFPPVDPVALRWSFPLWLPDGAADPRKLRGRMTAGEIRQTEKDREGMEAILAALEAGPATARQLREQTGISRERQQRLLDLLTASGELAAIPVTIRGNETNEYHLQK